MRELVARQVVSKTSFAQENEISVESVDDLLGHTRGSESRSEVVKNIDGYLVCEDYQQQLAQNVQQRLSEAVETAT